MSPTHTRSSRQSLHRLARMLPNDGSFELATSLNRQGGIRTSPLNSFKPGCLASLSKLFFVGSPPSPDYRHLIGNHNRHTPTRSPRQSLHRLARMLYLPRERHLTHNRARELAPPQASPDQDLGIDMVMQLASLNLADPRS